MQQINLYTDAFKPLKVKLPLEQLILFPVLLLVILIAGSVGLSIYLDDKKTELAGLKDKQAVMAERIQVLSEKANKLRQDDALVAANKRLKEIYSARESMIETLDRVVLKETEGFSETLVALARQKEKGLWLTSILLGSANNQMLLQGVTLRAELVPAYLQNLRQESSFIGRQFALFQLNENEEAGSGLSFTLKAEDSASSSTPLISPLANQTVMPSIPSLGEEAK